MQDLTFFYKLLSGLKLFLIPEFHPRPLLGINNSKISPFDIERFDEYTLKHFDGCYLRIHAELPILWLMSGLAFLNINIPNVRSIFLLFTSVIKRASRFFSFRFVSFIELKYLSSTELNNSLYCMTVKSRKIVFIQKAKNISYTVVINFNM